MNRKNTKRGIAAVLALLLMLSCLTACAGERALKTEPPETTGPESTQPQQTEQTNPTDGETEPETTAPESTEPEQTEPEATEPVQTEPEQTQPETKPEQTKPAETKPAETKPAQTEPEETTPISGQYSREELEAMDTTTNGWGPGVNRDEDGRPYGSLTEQKKYGKYDAYFIAPADNQIYLTFDEGYENGYTTKILDVLKEKNVKAVFFVTMHYCKNNPELVQRMIDEGHAVGNHSVNHKSMPSLSIDKMISEVMDLHEYVKEHFGYEMHLFRPPMGEYSQQSLAVLQSLGYKTVQWSFAYYDYEPDDQMEPTKAFNKVIDFTHAGAIYLLHAVSKTNTEILGDVIDEMRAQGYRLELFT